MAVERNENLADKLCSDVGGHFYSSLFDTYMHFITQSESFSGSTGGPSLKIAGWLEPTFVNVQTLDPGMIRLRY